MKPRKSVYFSLYFLDRALKRFYVLLNYLLCLITEQRQAPLDGLAGLAETRVEERLVLGDLQHRDLGLTDQ